MWHTFLFSGGVPSAGAGRAEFGSLRADLPSVGFAKRLADYSHLVG